jgi:hypothetical protein
MSYEYLKLGNFEMVLFTGNSYLVKFEGVVATGAVACKDKELTLLFCNNHPNLFLEVNPLANLE